MMVDDKLQHGIALAKIGKIVEARNVLSKVIKNNPKSEAGWLWLAWISEKKEHKLFCINRILQINPNNKAAKSFLARLNSETPKDRSQFFVGHELTQENRQDLRRVIKNTFNSLEPYYADEAVEGKSVLFKICQKIFLTPFSLFDLSVPNPNVYLELGIALGLNKPIIMITKESSQIPFSLEGHNIIIYTGYSDLKVKLSKLRDQGFLQTLPNSKDYCYFCNKVCDGMATPPDDNAYLILEKNRLLWRDLKTSLATCLSEYHLYPIFLTNDMIGPVLCNIRRKVLSSQFSICKLGDLADPNSFLALGMAIGSAMPWLLLSNPHDRVPSNLQGYDRIEYSTFSDLEIRLSKYLDRFLKMVIPHRLEETEDTNKMDLPFWIQFDIWKARIASPVTKRTEIKGQIRVVKYQGKKYLGRNIISARGLLFGRSHDCDVVIESHMVSARQFHILRRRDQRYFVEDLHSKNGTWLNGNLLRPGIPVEIGVGDTIIVHGARFVIWDDTPLPEIDNNQSSKKTGSLTPLVERIEIPDLPPPSYMNGMNHWLRLVVLTLDGQTTFEFEVQTFYPVSRILKELAILMKLPEKQYRFLYKNELIDEYATPLSLDLKQGTLLELIVDNSGMSNTILEI